MKLTQYQWAALILGVSVFLGTFGVALAATVAQVTREVPSTFSFAEVQVLPDENLGLYHDRDATDPVTSLPFSLLMLQPPLTSDGFARRTIYIRNESDTDLMLIEPCRSIFDRDDASGSVRLGHIDAVIYNLSGPRRGDSCPPQASGKVSANLPPGEMFRAVVDIHPLDPELAPGDYSFTTLFGAVEPTPVQPPPGMVSW